MSDKVEQIVTYVALSLAFLGLAAWFTKKSEDPARTAFKWIVSLGLVLFIRWKAFPMAERGGMVTFSAIALSAVGGLGLFILWRQEIGAVFAKPFTSLYDGGDVGTATPRVEPYPTSKSG